MNKSDHVAWPPPDKKQQSNRRGDSNVQIAIVSPSVSASVSQPVSPSVPASIDHEADPDTLTGEHFVPIGPTGAQGADDLRLLLASHTRARLASILSSGEEHREFVAPAWMFVNNELGAATARPVEIHLVIAENVRRICIDTPSERALGDEKIRSSAQWLTENCEQPISVADAARTVAMSERNFLRRFRHETGLTPSEYLLRARLNRTCKLLAESDLPIDKIARRSGMGNGAQLAKLFRKRFGISPSEFRNRARAEVIAQNLVADNPRPRA
ncbi:helix-turn-helix domain-containing protein [Paraburkholderia xenovorans]|uniref:helix-turn-helix domain-containing protein n=1 Tax=Paraburkholderia xenovorans TaxID=36873 RepID=UPI0038BA9EBB